MSGALFLGVGVMTPAIELVRKKKLDFRIHSYEHDPNTTSYGLEAVEVLGHDPEKVFKTLLFCLETDAKVLAVAVIPVDRKLNLKLAAKAAKFKKVQMADPNIAQKITGYLVGGISPIAQKKRLATFIDQSALNHEKIYVSGGRRGLEIELSPNDLSDLTLGRFIHLCRDE
jgi:Cys-tRNA(Pro)/Cys-tRNA(Cys) deacylase